MPDDTPLVQPSQVVRGQWEPRKVLHACPLTKEGRLFTMKKMQQVGVIDPIEEGSDAGVADNSGGSGNNMEELPQKELDSLQAK